MGLPDYWIRIIKTLSDENWNMTELWYELNNRRIGEKTISYTESHDQALVGDQTLIFRLVKDKMYEFMHKQTECLEVDRGIALHKIIRLITLAIGGEGYLNFMGNEFGHPEWIDFPRHGNNWSYNYARRQWHLRDDPNLLYHFLADFDRDMIGVTKDYEILVNNVPCLLHEHDQNKILAFERAGLVFIFNFNPVQSFTDYQIPAPAGCYKIVLDSDHIRFGGHGRLQNDQLYSTNTCQKGVGEPMQLPQSLHPDSNRRCSYPGNLKY